MNGLSFHLKISNFQNSVDASISNFTEIKQKEEIIKITFSQVTFIFILILENRKKELWP